MLMKCIVFSLFVVVILSSSLSSAYSAPFRSVLRSDTFNLEGALQRVALKFFPPDEVGVIYSVSMTNRTELHSRGVEYELYTVERDYVPIGSFVRYRVFSDKASRIDIALLVQNGIVESALCLQIPVIEGKPILHLENVFTALKGCQVTDYADSLALVFKSLIFAEQISENIADSGPVLSDEAGRAFSKALFDSLPKPSVSLPSFSFETIDGIKISDKKLAGKGLLVLWVSLTDNSTGGLIKIFEKFNSASSGIIQTVIVSTDGTDEMMSYVDRGGHLPSNVVLDGDEEYKSAFVVPVVPYITGYNRQGKLILSSLFYDRKKLEGELDKFKREVLE